MLDKITLDKMNTLKLHGMRDAFEHLQSTQVLQSISFAEGLSMLVDRETTYRDNKRLARLLKNAKLRYPQAMVEDVDKLHNRGIAPEKLRLLIAGQWLDTKKNIILLGPTGIGKTYLACACAQLACRQGYNTRYLRMSKLFEAIRLAKADGTYTKLTNSLNKVNCLVLDDWGLDPITPERRADLLEIIDDNYEQRSLIIASQLPAEHWHDYIGDSTIADAILDRVIHQAEIFNLKGGSMRKALEAS